MTLKGSGRLREVELQDGLTVLMPPIPGVVFTTRLGGTSALPFASLNLSTSVGDDPASVAANRRRVSEALGISPEWAMARQVHGCDVAVAGKAGETPEADALVVTAQDLPVAVLVADCVPIALGGPGVAGAVHAGWRGLCRGVVGAAVAAAGAGVTAWIGPCIGPCCFEVGPEVPARFAAAHPEAPGCSEVVGGTLRFDLRRAAALALVAAGATVAADPEVPCTSCDPRFFSHRGDRGTTGRQAVVTWRPSISCARPPAPVAALGASLGGR